MLQVRKSTLSLLFILLTIKFRSIPALEPALNQVQQLDPISHKPSWFPHNIDNYVLFDKNMVACIMLHSAIQISFPVKNENDQFFYLETVDLPLHAVTITGNCSLGRLTLSWDTFTNKTNDLVFYFAVNESHYDLQYVTGKIWWFDPPPEENVTELETYFIFQSENANHHVEASFNHSYYCREEVVISGNNGSTVNLRHFKVEAFRKSVPWNLVFGPAVKCSVLSFQLITGIVLVAIGGNILLVYFIVGVGACAHVCCFRGRKKSIQQCVPSPSKE
ncbi:uncharacterized protein LOC118434486 [Folsomia candida]|uniref:Lysosome-associated membrane glycoprotein 5 n=1 Tax=Folsomia candida TaxID=158441 RepID=A0A226EX57_FOLCA|nr:uncharacterized protein LOC118434486 [Folsomia candida]OXA62172.1 hypothetical protein Fcan01_00798 [Folsomia candida]